MEWMPDKKKFEKSLNVIIVGSPYVGKSLLAHVICQVRITRICWTHIFASKCVWDSQLLPTKVEHLKGIILTVYEKVPKGETTTDIHSRVVFMKREDTVNEDGESVEGEWTFLVPPEAWKLDARRDWNGWVHVSDGVSDTRNIYTQDEPNPTKMPHRITGLL